MTIYKCNCYKNVLIVIFITLNYMQPSLSTSRDEIVYKVGALFHRDDGVAQVAFKLGINAANDYLKTCRSKTKIQLHPIYVNISESNSVQAHLEVCRLFTQGVIAIAGPTHSKDPQTSAAVHSRTHLHGIPHVYITWRSQMGNHFSVNTHPSYKSYGRALRDFIHSQIDQHSPNFFRFGIIYQEPETMLKYEELLNSIKMPILIRQWKKNGEKDYVYILKYFSKLGQFNFLVDIAINKLETFFKIAQSLNMTREYYNYYITTWDVERCNFTHFSQYFHGANVTSFALTPIYTSDIDNNPDKANFIRQMMHLQKLETPYLYRAPSTESLLLHDAVLMLARGLHRVSESRIIQPQHIQCDERKMWNDGATLINYIRALPQPETSHQSNNVLLTCDRQFQDRLLSGPLEIGADGYRSNYKLIVDERLPYPAPVTLGYWTEKEGMVITKNYTQTQDEIRESLKSKTLYVTTIIDEPFVFYKHKLMPGEIASTDPDMWDGFCIALLKNISMKLGFKISMNLVRDGQYGKIRGVGTDGQEIWNGMIGELMNKTADLAIASLTITYDRERVIDFTTPYMSLGLSIIYRKPEKKKPSLFSFLHPLSAPVWGYMLAAYIVVSIILFTVARFSPFEWYNPHPCNTESDTVENQFNINNSLWFTIGSLMQQGSEMAPKANSTRLVSGSWWFFTLIMISSYTANLAAFLTVERMKSPIENVEDLSKQTAIKYGIIEGGATYRFFEKASIPTYKRMFEFMSNHKAQCLVTSTNDGINRVLKYDYAFILESTMNEYYTQRNCRLMQVGGLLDSKGYGIGLPAGSPYVDVFSETILELQNSQIIEELRQFWWRKFKIEIPCDDEHGSSGKSHLTNALGLEQVGGAFIILSVGMATSIAIAAIEFYIKHFKTDSNICRSLWSELRFALQCCVSTKRKQKVQYEITYEDNTEVNETEATRYQDQNLADDHICARTSYSHTADRDPYFHHRRLATNFASVGNSRTKPPLIITHGYNGDAKSTKL